MTKIYTEINYEWKDGALVEVSSEFFEYDGPVAKCKGAGGGGNSYSYQSSIPKWAESAHKELLGQAGDYAYGMGYPDIESQRIQGWSPQEQAVFARKEQMVNEGDPYGEYARRLAESSGNRVGTMSGVQSGYQGLGPIDAGSFGDSRAREYDYGTFGQQQADYYTNPYWQNVAEQEMSTARDEFAQQRKQTAAERIASGSRGGYRAALDDRFGRIDEAESIANIRGRHASRAYGDAQQQYERDRTAAMGAGRMSEESLMNAQRRYESDRQAYFKAVQMGDVAEQERTKRNLEAATYNQDMILKQAEAEREAAKLMTGVGDAQQKAAYERLKQLEMAGASQREMIQAATDLDYQQQWDQAMWPQRQMNWYSGILSGVPGGAWAPKPSSPSIASQLAGFGLGAAALSQMGNS